MNEHYLASIPQEGRAAVTAQPHHGQPSPTLHWVYENESAKFFPAHAGAAPVTPLYKASTATPTTVWSGFEDSPDNPPKEQTLSFQQQSKNQSSAKPRPRRRTQVRRACQHCAKAHAACDSNRPCNRCTKLGLTDCMIPPRKQRASNLKSRKNAPTRSSSVESIKAVNVGPVARVRKKRASSSPAQPLGAYKPSRLSRSASPLTATVSAPTSPLATELGNANSTTNTATTKTAVPHPEQDRAQSPSVPFAALTISPGGVRFRPALVSPFATPAAQLRNRSLSCPPMSNEPVPFAASPLRRTGSPLAGRANSPTPRGSPYPTSSPALRAVHSQSPVLLTDSPPQHTEGFGGVHRNAYPATNRLLGRAPDNPTATSEEEFHTLTSSPLANSLGSIDSLFDHTFHQTFVGIEDSGQQPACVNVADVMAHVLPDQPVPSNNEDAELVGICSRSEDSPAAFDNGLGEVDISHYLSPAAMGPLDTMISPENMDIDHFLDGELFSSMSELK